MFLLNTLGRRSIQSLLLLADGILFLFSIWLIHSFRFLTEPFGSDILVILQDRRFWVILFFVYLSHYIFDLYEPKGWRRSVSSPLRLLLAFLCTLLLVFSWLYLTAQVESEFYGRGIFLGSMLLFTSLSFTYRLRVQRRLKREVEKNRFLLISSKTWAEEFSQEFAKVESAGAYEWLQPEELVEKPHLLGQRLREPWTAVVVENDLPSKLVRHLMDFRLHGVRIVSFPNFYELYWAKIPVHTLDDSWFAFTEGFSLLHSRVNARIKRVVDILLSLTLLFLLAPVMFVLWALIRLESPGNSIYSQTRVGRDGEPFTMYKFRSMRQNSEKDGAKWAALNDQRTTFIGRWIRKVRLDETPQLVNILRGDMSFIGPRPERPEFTESLRKVIPFYELRHLVKPGLTGWAQVMFPYGASVEDAKEKLEYELYYIKNQSVELDIKIVAKTLAVVLFGAGR